MIAMVINKKVIMCFLIFFMFMGTAQAQDTTTTCVPTEQLERLRDDVQEMEKKIRDLERINQNFRQQIATLEQLRTRDSLLLSIKDRRIGVREEIIEYRDVEITGLRESLQSQKRRKWLYFIGGAATVIGSAYVVGQTQ